MEKFIHEQLIIFVYSIILGLIFGGIYDIMRILHIWCGTMSCSRENRGMKKGKFSFCLYFLLDGCYVLIVTCLFSVFLFAFNFGEFRLYLLFGVTVGMGVYLMTVGRLVMFFAQRITDFVKKILWLVLFRPLWYIIRGMGRLGRFVWMKTGGACIKAVRRRMDVLHTERVRRCLVRTLSFSNPKRKERDL